MTAPREEWLRPTDVQAEYRIPTSTLSSWRSNGIGPEWQPVGPRRIAYRRSSIEAWLVSEQQRVTRGQVAS